MQEPEGEVQPFEGDSEADSDTDADAASPASGQSDDEGLTAGPQTTLHASRLQSESPRPYRNTLPGEVPLKRFWREGKRLEALN